MASLAGVQSQNDETLDLAVVDSFQGPLGQQIDPASTGERAQVLLHDLLLAKPLSDGFEFFWIHICFLKAWIESVPRQSVFSGRT